MSGVQQHQIMRSIEITWYPARSIPAVLIAVAGDSRARALTDDRVPGGMGDLYRSSFQRNNAQLAQRSVSGSRRSAALNVTRDAGCAPRPCSNRVMANPQQAPVGGVGATRVAASGVIS